MLVNVDLTERQLQILRLVAAGKAHKQIARELGISAETVAKHLAEIYRRVGAANAPHAVALVWGQGSGARGQGSE